MQNKNVIHDLKERIGYISPEPILFLYKIHN